MFTRFHEMRERREGGFTLIELLVVILIIAILAAIAIPVFLNQRKKGWKSQVQSALKNAATAQESFLTSQNPATYATALADLEGEGYRGAPDVTLVEPFTIDGGDSFCIDATHSNLDEPWRYDSNVGEPEEDLSCA